MADRDDLLSWLRSHYQFMELQKLRTPESLVWKHGSEMPARAELKCGVTPKSQTCYLNAWKLFKQLRKKRTSEALFYCEGFVALKSCPIPVMHGWVEHDGLVKDSSVEQNRAATYYGVRWRWAFADDCWRKLDARGYIGILGNAWLLRLQEDELVEGIWR